MSGQRYQYRAPNGELIVGRLDTVQGRANIHYFDADGDVEFEGSTDVFWDGQEAVYRDGDHVYLDTAACEWTLDQCTREPLGTQVDDDDEPDGEEEG